MYAADLKHPNSSLQDKLETLYRSKADNKPIELGFRAPYLGLLKAFGNPHLNLPPVIHVAGTNGKGSSIAMLRAILEAAGYKVHAYTSPHLLRFNERIVLGGQEIDDDTLELLIDQALRLNDDEPLTFFEITTAIAFAAFESHDADIVLLETGLGGRLDCTNVVPDPILTLITTISHDHMEFLGHDIESIASEKAGIIKDGVPCVLGHQVFDGAFQTIKKHTQNHGSPLFIYGDHFGSQGQKTHNKNGFSFYFETNSNDYKTPSLKGLHQIHNAASVIAACHIIQDQIQIHHNHIATGLQNVTWPARLEQIREGDTEIWYDGGHNDTAGSALASWLEMQHQTSPKSCHIILGMKADKQGHDFIAPFQKHIETLHVIPLSGVGECITARHLTHLQNHLLAQDHPNLDSALRAINEGYPGEKRILICGSLYLAAEISAILKP